MAGKIIFVGDAHIGINFPFKRNITTGISERSLDFIKNIRKISDYAIQTHSELIIFTGDLYDRPSINPTFRKIVREEIFIPLKDAGIPILIISGNHDSPMALERGSSIEDLASLSNVQVFRKPISLVRRIGGKSVGIILIPYLYPSQLVEFLENQVEIGPIDLEHQFSSAQQILKNWAFFKLEDINTEIKLMVGHYYIKGSQISSDYNPEVLPGEFTFTESMIPCDLIDLCVFGHVHLFQTLKNGKIVIPGSIERIDFGERGDSKGFIEFDTSTKQWIFQKLETRTLIKKEIEIPDTIQPTKSCIEQLSKLKNLKDSIVRLEIISSLANRMKLNLPSVELLLKETFYSEIKFIEKKFEAEKTILESYLLDPAELVSDFINQAYSSNPKKEKLKKKAIEIINSLIESED